ncbi:MAG TPA: hypothetical protein VF186_10085 [Gaiellaceae bacterium]|jgi:hypothetical protein
MDGAAERKARNEAIFREANEKIEAAREKLELADAKTPFFCECDDPHCRMLVPLDLRDYETVRANPAAFLIASGHSDSFSTVVAEHDAYDVVEKEGAARRVALETDPRSGDG